MASARAHAKHQLIRIRKIFRKAFGFRVRWLAKLLWRGYSFGLSGLDKKIFEAIDTSPNYYVEIGANDGVAQSNTLGLELFHGWRGLLIEPIESTFEKLCRNRSKKRNYLLRSACVQNAYTGATVDMVYSGLMTVAIGLESDIADPIVHAASGEKYHSVNAGLRVQSAPATTMTHALEMARAPERIGLLSLGVEGAEMEVLKGIDFDRWTFDYMVIESRDLEKITSFLKNHGYALQAQLSHHDYLFSQKNQKTKTK